MTSHTIPNNDVVYDVIYDAIYDIVYDIVFYNWVRLKLLIIYRPFFITLSDSIKHYKYNIFQFFLTG